MSECVLHHGLDVDNQEIHKNADDGLLLCDNHLRRLGRTNTEIRDLWYDLTFILEAGTAPKDETPKTRHLKSAEAPAPANLEALSLRDKTSHGERIAARAYCHQCGDIGQTSFVQSPEASRRYAQWAANLHTTRTGHSAYVADGDNSTPIPAVLAIVASWLLLVAEERPLTATALPKSVIAQLSLLERHHEWMAAQEWIGDYVSELDDLRKALKLAVRDHTHKVVGRCHLAANDGTEAHCGGTLMQENGAHVVRCVKCAAQWSSPHERAMLSMSMETPA